MNRALICIALAVAASSVSAVPWTYQGTLNDGGKAANGRYDIRLTLVDDAGIKSVSSPITLYGVSVKNGNFSAEVDFGFDLSNAPMMKLKTEVAQGDAAFVALGEPTAFDPKATLAGLCWDTTGNVAVAGEFIGSTNNMPLVLKSFNTNVARYQGGMSDGTVNIVAGSLHNTVSAIAFGQTVAGGGRFAGGLDQGNSTTQTFATVSGGFDNEGTGYASTVGGGNANRASGHSATVSGGSSNCAGGNDSWAGGRVAMVRSGNGASNGFCLANSGDSDGDEGTFVWSDRSLPNNYFVSSGPNQFLIRAAGGVGINTATLGAAIDLRLSELVVRNPDDGGNTDISLMNRTDRGYNLVSVPGTAGAAGSFAIGEVDARTSGVGFVNRLFIAPNGDFSVSANAFKPGGGAWAVSSDARLKSDVAPLAGSLDRLLQLRGVNFNYRADAPQELIADGPQIGFIAQEVEQVFPQWISAMKGYKTVSIKGFEALTVEALRELRGESALIDDAQTSRIAELESENAGLRARLDAIEARLAK